MKYKGIIKGGQTQGGIKFEISWEPNFPVNNFARNNGKIAPSPLISLNPSINFLGISVNQSIDPFFVCIFDESCHWLQFRVDYCVDDGAIFPLFRAKLFTGKLGSHEISNFLPP